jgi:hypothetical protein
MTMTMTLEIIHNLNGQPNDDIDGAWLCCNPPDKEIINAHTEAQTYYSDNGVLPKTFIQFKYYNGILAIFH